MDSGLGRFPVAVEIPVAWGDMDSFQHVNNVVYLRWLETARIAYFERVGLMVRMGQAGAGVGPILARTTIDYLRPVEYPDTVRIQVTVSRIGGSSFVMGYRVHSAAHAAEVAKGDSVIVMYDYGARRTCPVDAPLRAAIAALEAKGA